MSTNRVQQQDAYILHTRPYTESSLIIEVFTKDFGRLGLLAKGARNHKNKKRGVLQPFQPLLISWQGKGDLPILTEIEQGKGLLLFDYKSRVCGFYVNELIYKLLHRRDPNKGLYSAYSTLMNNLDVSNNQQLDREVNLRLFEKQLLAEIGYALILDRDIDSEELINPELVYEYIPERGPQKYQARSSQSPLIVSGMVLHSIHRNRYPNDVIMNQSKRFMRHMLQIILAGKTIISRHLLYISQLH